MSTQDVAAIEQLRGIRNALQGLTVKSSTNTNITSIAVTGADVTLTSAQAESRCLTTTGVLTGNRNVYVPNSWEGIMFNNNTGAFSTTVTTIAGTGIAVAQGKRAILFADGTNVVRVTADV